MFEERSDMTNDPYQPESGPPDLEALLVADEASISDDGFSQRVAAGMTPSSSFRQVTIYGAGLMGFGFAVGSIPALVKALPPLRVAVDGAAKVPDLIRLPDLSSLSSFSSLSSGSQATFLVLGATVAMVLTSVLLVARER
jgi:hypothetical protein